MPIATPRFVLAPEAVVEPVPPLATGSAPVTPVVSGNPVALVSVPLDGVPSAGVTKVGLLANTSAPEPVSSVTADARLAELGVAKKVATPVAVDPDLLQYDEVWAAAGTWNDVFPIAPNDLVRASGAAVTDLKRE